MSKISFRVVLIALLVISNSYPIYSQLVYYVATDGDNSNSGTSSEQALASVAVAFSRANPGDTIRMMPGTYTGKIALNNISGDHDNPIVLISESDNKDQYAVLDGGAPEPAADVRFEVLDLNNCHWLVFQNLKVQNAWTDPVPLRACSYLTFKGCEFYSGRRVIVPREDTHHILVEDCLLEYPDDVWQGIPWEELHSGYARYYNGALLHPRNSAGGHIMRGCRLINVFNGYRTKGEQIAQNDNIEVYNNDFINVRDNAIEPESWAWNLFVYNNRMFNIHKAYSIDDVQGGYIYIFATSCHKVLTPMQSRK